MPAKMGRALMKLFCFVILISLYDFANLGIRATSQAVSEPWAILESLTGVAAPNPKPSFKNRENLYRKNERT